MPLKRHRLKIGTVGNGVEENKGLVRRTENDRSRNIRVLYLGLFAWVKREISERKTFFFKIHSGQIRVAFYTVFAGLFKVG